MTSPARRLLGRLSIITALGVAGAVTLPVSAAQANLVNLGACNTSVLGQPFLPWNDAASYELSPGGDFESSAWTLTNGAQIVSGSEPYAATGTLGSSSLSLPAGSSAESPLTCVDAAYPTVRMFIAGTGLVAVSVVDGALDIPAGLAIASGDWEPSSLMLTEAQLLGLLSGGTAEVSLQITALTGNPRIDDVFIDPWNRG